MATYRNGRLPASILVERDGIYLTAGTWAKWDALVADVRARFGATLTITRGDHPTVASGGYRSWAFQGWVRQKYANLGKPSQAAAQGTSSHGGEYKGRDALAVDVNNYWAIPRAEFFAAARRAGFTPNVFDGKGGRPLEDWHLIDYDPYRSVAPAAEAPASTDESEEDDMKPRQIHYKDARAGRTVRALCVPGTGYFVKWTESGSIYANGIAKNMETGSSTELTESVFGVFEREAMALRPKDALSILVADAS